MKGNKRSAAEAFGNHNQPSLLTKHRSKATTNGSAPSPTAKIVHFHDDQGQAGEESEKTRSDHYASSLANKQNKIGSLKQRAQELVSTRQRLPIYSHADAIRHKLRIHNVLLLVGETGSGKSTQIPQFLINEPWCQRKTKTKSGIAVGGCIAITQPRRVAAISLARRVAEEMGTPLGNSSPASQVGYSVRFENSTSPSTRIKFLTEGMLLQEMLRDPWLKEYSAVVVDEVHERGVNVDLVLGFLQRMQNVKKKDDGRAGVPMKVVVMSATADMDMIKDFFSADPKDSGPSPSPGEPGTKTADKDQTRSKPSTSSFISTSLHIKGRQHPVTINYTPTPVPDILDAAYQRIVHIHTSCPLPGDILVFLTGQETVESLLQLLTSYSNTIASDPSLSRSLPKLLLLPLYAALPSHLQQRVFTATPKFTRKIILSTNIAETSITVPGIRHVVDTGKAKQRLFRPSLNLDTLLTVPISRSSANQRSGRAGRDAPGTAWRLYTESDFWKLSQDTQPEILRCDLSQLALTLKSHGVEQINTFPFLTEPPKRALERALVHLLQLSALDPSNGSITELGRQMSALPLPANLARVFLASARPEYSCIEEIIDIVSALSVENIFLNIQHSHVKSTENKSVGVDGHAHVNVNANTNANANANGDHDSDSDSGDNTATTLRRQLYRREGDHLTLLAAMQAYTAEAADRKRWCSERYISHRAMSGAMDVRKQLTAIMARYTATRHQHGSGGKTAGATATTSSKKNKKKNKNKSDQKEEDQDGKEEQENHTTTTTDINTTNKVSSSTSPSDQDLPPLPTRILRCLLTGFHTNVARLSHDGSYRTILTNQVVAIHPSSVLFSIPNSTSSGDNDDESTNGGAKRSKGSARGGGPGVKKFEAIMYNEFVYTGTKAYARGVSAVEMGWVAEAVKLNSGR
ncbi:hypothetical protein PV10_06376 [Exophiala mesophila]|uniref:RNA helicase n=1 Tax=Exophiala mesophila TaxID=212818 RepID=A0A0D1WRU0_EXOME|nr:uncharacterized protein PV10_06376 [Exophiala mesophila]KIV91885.1 hypothetical protein PV10_06376 [Exophiala mesophila]